MSKPADSMVSSNVDEQAAQPPGPDAGQWARALRAAAAPYAGAGAPGGRRILVPLDGSRRAERALDHARAMSALGDARVTLLRVAVPRLVSGVMPPPPVLGQDEPSEEEREARAYLDAVAASLGDAVPGVATRTAVSARVDDAIVTAAREARADLIAMTTHGRSGLARVLLGSVATSVVRKSPVPVLLVRAEDPDGAGRVES